MATLEIRNELFDHWVYPNQAKITEQSLVTLFKSLHILSSVTYKISIFQWIEQALKHIPGMSVTEAEIYFKTYTILLSNIEREDSGLDEEEYKIEDSSSIENVDVRWFSLFMLIQLFIHAAKDYTVTHSNYTTTPWPGMAGGAGGGREIASPRSKATKVSYTSSETSIIFNFVKANLRTILKLVSSEIHKKDEIKLNRNEMDTLRVLFRIEEQGKYVPMSISQICPLFEDASKVSLNEIYKWISANLSEKVPESELNIKNLMLCVTIRDSETVQQKDIRLHDWEDWYVYLDSNINSISIINWRNCIIMVAAWELSWSIDKWEKTQVTIATNLLRIGNSVDWVIYSYSGANVPILYGDNRNVVLAPHNVGYSTLNDHVKAANIPINTLFIKNYSKPILTSGDKSSYTLLEEGEFYKLAMPKEFIDSALLLTPQSYADAISKRVQMFLDLKEKIAQKKLNSDEEKMLHVAIQGYFREWLVTNNHHKKIYDLINLIE